MTPSKPDHALREAAALAIRKSPLSIYEIAARMSEMLETDITATSIHSRTSKSKAKQLWPAIRLVPFAVATGNYKQVEVINKAAGYPTAGSTELIEAAIAGKERAIQKEPRDLEELKKLLSEKRR